MLSTSTYLKMTSRCNTHCCFHEDGEVVNGGSGVGGNADVHELGSHVVSGGARVQTDVGWQGENSGSLIQILAMLSTKFSVLAYIIFITLQHLSVLAFMDDSTTNTPDQMWSWCLQFSWFRTNPWRIRCRPVINFAVVVCAPKKLSRS